MIAQNKGNYHRTINSKQIDNSSAREIIASNEHLVNKLIKKQQLSQDIITKQKLIYEVLSPVHQPEVVRYAENLKLDDYEKYQILNYQFTNQAKLLLILPGLERLSSKELTDLVKIKEQYLPQ